MMSASPAFSPSPSVFDEMQRLHLIGYSILPLGGGEDGKAPLVSFKSKKRLPLNVVMKRMDQKRSSMYAIRTGGLLVVDCDTDNDATRAYVEQRFGLSPFTVKTPRGRHYYFKAGDACPKNVRLPDIVIDFKTGANSYVAGPYSVRPDCGVYSPEGSLLNDASALPCFKDRQPDQTEFASGMVPVGQRNFSLLDKALELVECVDSEAELYDNLWAYADWHFEDAANFSDAEVRKVAAWAWNKRLSNDLWGGSKSAVKIYQHEFETLMAGKDGPLGLSLLHCLRHNHLGSRRSGKPFMIAREAMTEANVINGWNANYYRRAKNSLLNACLIECVKEGNRFTGPSQYVFSQPKPQGEGFLLHSGVFRTPKNGRLKTSTNTSEAPSVGNTNVTSIELNQEKS